ncbi:MAG: hypothetical protein ACQXXH_00820 [Candidatus Bathyarchaeia archaeon]|jgi:hypothetical protein|nr:hypothetical protein [Candidatus Bathyarchaeota archaeon A05DMB-4]MDH7595391.1 hypothetical protein [Candidatus Bathyarchaeota archaeon]
MEDEKLIEKLKKELLTLQNQIDECNEKREKLVEDYTKQLLSFEVVDVETKQEIIHKKH